MWLNASKLLWKLAKSLLHVRSSVGMPLARDERKYKLQDQGNKEKWREKLPRRISAHGELQLLIVTRSRGCLDARATELSSLECATWTSLLAHATLQHNRKMRFRGKKQEITKGEKVLGSKMGAPGERGR
jgi:hypothetical protein